MLLLKWVRQSEVEMSPLPYDMLRRCMTGHARANLPFDGGLEEADA